MKNIKELRAIISQEIAHGTIHGYSDEIMFISILFQFNLGRTNYDKIAFAPANEFTKYFVEFIKFYTDYKVVVLDQNITRYEDLHIENIKVISPKIETVYIFSTKYNQLISKQIEKTNSHVQIIDTKNLIEQSPQIDLNYLGSFLVYYKQFMSKKHKHLVQRLSSSKLMFVTHNYLFDVEDKVNIIAKTSDYNVFRLGKDFLNIDGKEVAVNIFDLIVFLLKYRKEKKFLFFTTHNPMNHTLAFLLKVFFKKSYLITYIYDDLYGFCPPSNQELAQKYLQWQSLYCHYEYQSLQKLLEEKIADLIIYKDGAENHPLYKNVMSPKVFFPAYLSKDLYVYPALDKNRKKFVYIGTVLSPFLHTQELGATNFFPHFFNAFLNQGYSVDIYSTQLSQLIVREYNELCPKKENSARLCLKQGNVLDKLLKKIQGQYGWGLVLQKKVKNNKKILYKQGFPSKILTYLALGIPIIISDIMEYGAAFVKEHEIGIVINENELDNLKIRLEQSNYEKFVENILSLREKLALENKKSQLVEAFMKTTIDCVDADDTR
jgi:hypothetical protein